MWAFVIFNWGIDNWESALKKSFNEDYEWIKNKKSQWDLLNSFLKNNNNIKSIYNSVSLNWSSENRHWNNENKKVLVILKIFTINVEAFFITVFLTDTEF